MKTISRILIFALAMTVTGVLQAQTLDLVEKTEVYEKEHIPKKDPVPYPPTREADVMFEKTIWRVINLREKMNHPFYYPLQAIGDRKNLTQVLLEVLQNPLPGHQVFAYKYNLFGGYEFEQPLSYEEIMENEDLVEGIPELVVDSVTGEERFEITSYELRLQNVERIFVKEKWYFDRRYSTLNVRIIGLCPVLVKPTTIPDPQTGEPRPTGEITRVPLFWVYYPEVRYYLAKQEAFNPANDAQRISFDDLLTQRRFSSYIYKESNVFENRRVSDYAQGMDAMFEAERIKNELFVWEHDLWEY